MCNLLRQVKIYLELFKVWLTAIMEFWKSWNYNILYTDKFSNKITEDLWNCYSVSWKSVDLIHVKHPTKILFGFDKISLTIILSSGLPFFITF